MDNINKTQHDELIRILNELINTLEQMQEKVKDYALFQNEREAREWIDFLKKHKEKDELKSLEDEIANRFFFKYDVRIDNSELDHKRVELMKIYLSESNNFLK